MEGASAGSTCLTERERERICEKEGFAATASADFAVCDLAKNSAADLPLPRLTGSLSTVYLLLHVHVLPEKQQQGKKHREQKSRMQLNAAAISRGFSSALLQHAGLLGVSLLPYQVLGYDARLSFVTLKTDCVSAPSLLLAAANIHSLDVAGEGKNTVKIPCFLTLHVYSPDHIGREGHKLTLELLHTASDSMHATAAVKPYGFFAAIELKSPVTPEGWIVRIVIVC
ncbi:hypothetical protein Efla_000714 [Eimeria flavescens]